MAIVVTAALVLGAPQVAAAEEPEACRFICSLEWKFEPTITIENQRLVTRVLVVIACLAVFFSVASHAAAQSPAGPAFEVVSVKPSNPDALGPSMPPLGGRYTASNVSLRTLVQIAYEVSDFQIDGGPEWQTSRRFDIQAKAADPVVGLQAMLPMLRTLLTDRFQVKVHIETREMPIYGLVALRDDGRLGANITRSTADCSHAEQDLAEATAKDPGTVASRLEAGQGLTCAIMPARARAPSGMTWRGNGASMQDLARFLKATTGRVVQDRTGLTGLYDWEMTFDGAVRPQNLQQPGTDASLPSDSPSVTTALQDQLGLKLEPTRGPVEILVIDSAAMPNAN